MKCEWTSCDREVDGYVMAQWTVVDFIQFEVCDGHIDDVIAALARRKVDGELPMDLRWQHYEDFWEKERAKIPPPHQQNEA